MVNKLDDCIVLGKLIADDLTKHGEGLAKQLGKKHAIPVNRQDFSGATASGLDPDLAKYQDWINMR
jgi:hypothetical protein